jgi:hypothetical protein
MNYNSYSILKKSLQPVLILETSYLVLPYLHHHDHDVVVMMFAAAVVPREDERTNDGGER